MDASKWHFFSALKSAPKSKMLLPSLPRHSLVLSDICSMAKHGFRISFSIIGGDWQCGHKEGLQMTDSAFFFFDNAGKNKQGVMLNDSNHNATLLQNLSRNQAAVSAKNFLNIFKGKSQVTVQTTNSHKMNQCMMYLIQTKPFIQMPVRIL